MLLLIFFIIIICYDFMYELILDMLESLWGLKIVKCLGFLDLIFNWEIEF